MLFFYERDVDNSTAEVWIDVSVINSKKNGLEILHKSLEGAQLKNLVVAAIESLKSGPNSSITPNSSSKNIDNTKCNGNLSLTIDDKIENGLSTLIVKYSDGAVISIGKGCGRIMSWSDKRGVELLSVLIYINDMYFLIDY